jgi:hypothetical protein
VSDDAAAALKLELSRLTGAARTHPLLQLGRLLADRYWRAGPGTPVALPHLDGAIQAMEEAYGYFAAADGVRGTVAAHAGWLIGARYVAHGGSEIDRERGICLLEEALACPDLPPALRFVQLVLGTLYLSRASQGLQSPAMSVALRSGSAPKSNADADRAADCFHQLLAGPSLGAEVTTMAETMLTVAEAIQTMLGGIGPAVGGIDFGRMMAAMTTLQRFQEQVNDARRGVGRPPMPWLFDADRIVNLDPPDRPVTVMPGAEPKSPARPPAAPPVAPTTDLDKLRRMLRDTVVGIGGGDPAWAADLYPATMTILSPGAPPADIHTVDEFVGLATTIADDPRAQGTDSLMLAVATYLRSRTGGGGGWTADDDAPDDAGAATESLLAAARTLPTDQPGAVPVLLRLAALIGVDGVYDRLAEPYADVTRALRAIDAGGLALPYPDGLVLLDAATGRLAPSGAGRPLPHRLLVVGGAPVDADESVVSYVSSGAQVTAVAGRTRMALTADPVFVASPRGDREAASVAAMVLRRSFYPRSTGLGRTVEDVNGLGTPADVLAHINASLLHLDCEVTASGALELAGPAELSPEQIMSAPADRTAGGLVILPRAHSGFVKLSDALLAAGFTGVIGWLRPVPEPVLALMVFVLHALLADEGLTPTVAVHEIRRWMRDPDRKPGPDLPAGYAAALDGVDLADPAHWTPLVHHGI